MLQRQPLMLAARESRGNPPMCTPVPERGSLGSSPPPPPKPPFIALEHLTFLQEIEHNQRIER